MKLKLGWFKVGFLFAFSCFATKLNVVLSIVSVYFVGKLKLGVMPLVNVVVGPSKLNWG